MKQFDEWYAKEYEDLDPDFVGWTGEAMRDAFRAGMLAVADIVPNNYTQAEWKQVIEKAIACKDEG